MDLDVLKHRLHERLIARGVSPTTRAHVDHALDEAIKEVEERAAHQQTVGHKPDTGRYMTPEEIAADKTLIGEPQHETDREHAAADKPKQRRRK